MTPDFLDAEKVSKALPFGPLIEALRAAFASTIHAPERHQHALGGSASLLLMPAWRDGGYLGLKVVQVDPGRRPMVAASYQLYDQDSGALLAVLDGAMLTARRTAAMSALGADYLAPQDARTLLMVGTGVLAPHVIEAQCQVRPIERVLVWGRRASKAAEVAGQFDSAEVVTELTDAVPEADIICCATSSTSPLIMGNRVNPGTHVNLIGAYRPEMTEADPQTFAQADVYVDTLEGVMVEAGDLLQAIAAGAMTREDIKGALEDLCRKPAPLALEKGRTTVFKSVGTALADLAAAELVVKTHPNR